MLRLAVIWTCVLHGSWPGAWPEISYAPMSIGTPWFHSAGSIALIVALDHEARRRGSPRAPIVRYASCGSSARRSLARLGLACAVAEPARGRCGFEERRPRRRELVVLLAAVGEVEQRADAASRRVRRRELVARLGELAFFHQALALAKQRLGADGYRLVGERGAGRDEHGE